MIQFCNLEAIFYNIRWCYSKQGRSKDTALRYSIINEIFATNKKVYLDILHSKSKVTTKFVLSHSPYAATFQLRDQEGIDNTTSSLFFLKYYPEIATNFDWKL